MENRTQSAQGFTKEPTETLKVEEFVVDSSDEGAPESEKEEAA